MSEAFRWRLSQNDCQNRGYVLDGYPICYETANSVYFITPEVAKKDDEKKGDGEEEDAQPPADDEEADPAAKLPKFQKHIYPDSVILIRGDDD